MGDLRDHGSAFVRAYGQTWQEWDVGGFVELFTDDVIYVAHPTEETIVGRTALAGYVEKEQALQGAVVVGMGSPVIDGQRVAAEFWATCTDDPGATIAGAFIACLERDGRCSRFREYWFDIEALAPPYAGWGS